MRLRHLIKRKNKHIRKAFVLKNTWIENKNRKRLTQVFPFLRPLRAWQRKMLFYLKMLFDFLDIKICNKPIKVASFLESDTILFGSVTDAYNPFKKIRNLKKTFGADDRV